MHAHAHADEARPLEVGVVEHDGGRLAAQLEEQALHRRGALLHDPPADRGRAGERDEVDLAATATSSSATTLSDGVTTFTTPGGDVGLLGDQPTEARGVERRVAAPA